MICIKSISVIGSLNCTEFEIYISLVHVLTNSATYNSIFSIKYKQPHTRSEVDNFHELTWSMVAEAQAPASYDLSQCSAAYLVKSVLANNKWKTRNNIISVIKYTASHKVDIDQ